MASLNAGLEEIYAGLAAQWHFHNVQVSDPTTTNYRWHRSEMSRIDKHMIYMQTVMQLFANSDRETQLFYDGVAHRCFQERSEK
jgi:hypothetical protein